MDRWKKLCAKIGKDRFFIMIIGGLLLLVITYPLKTGDSDETTKSGLSVQNTKEETKKTESDAGRTETVMDEALSESAFGSDYADRMQTQLSEILSRISGAGKVEVCLTLSDYGTNIVEKDVSYTRDNEEQEGDDTAKTASVLTENNEETVFTADDSGNEVPFVRKTAAPEVEGVLIVAQGGGNEAVAREMKEAVMALFGIEEHKIKVVKMEGEEQ